MNKLINGVIATLIVGAILTGCGAKDDKSTADTSKNTASSVAQQVSSDDGKSKTDTNSNSSAASAQQAAPDKEKAKEEVGKIFNTVLNKKYNYTPQTISACQQEINKLALNNRKVISDSFVQNVKDKNITSMVGNVDNSTEKIEFKDGITVEGISGKFYGAVATVTLNYSENDVVLVDDLIVTTVYDTKTKTWKLADIKAILRKD